MKRVLVYMLAGMALVGTSCSDFLDTIPHDALSPSTTWQTEKDAEKFLIGCYDGWADETGILYWDCASDFGFNLHGRKLLYDENGNLAGAVGFHSYGAEGYAEYGYREAFAPFALGHVKYFDWDNYHFVDGDSSNCESVYSVSYHGISSAAWIDGWGFHPFYCPSAVSCCATGNPVSVAVELSNTYEDSASLSKRVAESIRFE